MTRVRSIRRALRLAVRALILLMVGAIVTIAVAWLCPALPRVMVEKELWGTTVSD